MCIVLSGTRVGQHTPESLLLLRSLGLGEEVTQIQRGSVRNYSRAEILKPGCLIAMLCTPRVES